MNWRDKIYESLTEGELKRQRKEQTKHGRRPLSITYKRGGKNKGAKTNVGKGFVQTGTGPTGKPKGTYTGKPKRRGHTAAHPGWRTQGEAEQNAQLSGGRKARDSRR
jgi:hypothetical protein